MPFIPVPNGIRVKVNFRQDNQELQNQFHVYSQDPPTLGSLTELAAVWAVWLEDYWAPVACNAAVADNVELTDISVANGIQQTVTLGGGIPGGLSSPQLPNNNTITASWRTGQSGRSFRGRTYHVGLTEAQVSGNIVTPTERTAIFNAYDPLPGLLRNAGYELSVLSLRANNAPRTTGVLTEVLAVIVEPTVDSQRRRLPGRGR